MARQITAEAVELFRRMLFEDEKGSATIEKYLRDLRKLQDFLGGRELSKENMVLYKEHLQSCGEYKASSINSFLAAANRFCEAMGWPGLKVKTLKIQEEAFRPEEKELTEEEYRRLVGAAMEKGDVRLAMILETMCSTGIRVGELPFVTVESLRAGKVDIYYKGKGRSILYPDDLQRVLKEYVEIKGLVSGPVFVTRTGRAVNRSNLWTSMRNLCQLAGVDPEKAFPHNLRHLFAKCFYELKQDIAKLANVLGHSNIETTRIYIRTSWREHKKQLDMMKLVVVTTLKGGMEGRQEAAAASTT